jgi:hypothetical protein
MKDAKVKQTKLNTTDQEILNSALSFALEFGENWLKPIQERLLAKYHFLSAKELNQYDRLCAALMEESNKYVYQQLDKAAKNNHSMLRTELKEELHKFLSKDYSWINEENLSHIFSQGCYYAYKDGVPVP